jgi:hypothetical protein
MKLANIYPRLQREHGEIVVDTEMFHNCTFYNTFLNIKSTGARQGLSITFQD